MKLGEKEVGQLRFFVEQCEKDSSILDAPELKFFRDFALKYAASAKSASPPPGCGSSHGAPSDPPAAAPVSDSDGSSSSESQSSSDEVSEDEKLPEVTDLLKPDTEPFPSAPSEGKDLSDEDMDIIADLNSKAAEAKENGDYTKALQYYSDILDKGHLTAMTFAKRAHVLMELKRPLACIADCDRALQLNEDNAKSCGLRGKAHRYLGNWEEAHKDLEKAQKIDYDEDLWEIQKVVSAHYEIIQRNTLKKKRAEEKAITKRKIKAAKQRQREAKRSAVDEPDFEELLKGMGANGQGGMPDFSNLGGMGGGMPGMPNTGSMGGGMPNMGGMGGGMPNMGGMGGGMPNMGGMGGGMPNMGGMGGGMPNMGGMGGGMPNMGGMGGGMPNMGGMGGGMPDMAQAMQDPEIVKMLQDPEMMKKIAEISQDPSKMMQSMQDPAMSDLMAKFMSKTQGAPQ